MYKIILLGAPLTGKTTLTNYLKNDLSYKVLDMDEELTRLNGGQWPGDDPERLDGLIKQIIADVLSRNEVVFSGFFFGVRELKEARKKGFEVVQLEVDMAATVARNKERMKRQPNNDAFSYYEKNLKYQNKIRRLGLVDRTINGNRPVSDIVSELLQLS